MLLMRAFVFLEILAAMEQPKSSASVTPMPTPVSEEAQSEPEVVPTMVEEQMALFETPTKPSAKEEIANQLEQLNLMDMTPMEVMNQLYKWQKKLRK